MKNISIILTALVLTLSGCEKNSDFGLEIYLLKDYQTKQNSFEIISGTEKLSKDPIIDYNNVVSYDSTDHYFVIDSLKAQQMSKTVWPTSGTPFAVTVNRQIIYSGYFIPGFSSMGADWYSIDPLALQRKLRVTLGYPVDQVKNQDLRNDLRIITLLIKDHKLN